MKNNVTKTSLPSVSTVLYPEDEGRNLEVCHPRCVCVCVCKLERVCSQTQREHTTAFNTEITYYVTKSRCIDLSITRADNVYSRALSSFEDNLKMASRGRNT